MPWPPAAAGAANPRSRDQLYINNYRRGPTRRRQVLLTLVAVAAVPAERTCFTCTDVPRGQAPPPLPRPPPGPLCARAQTDDAAFSKRRQFRVYLRKPF